MAARGPSDDELRRRLEDAAPLLEDARLRYRALLPALQAWGWRQRLRRVHDVAREVARTDAQVGAALDRAVRRAKTEAWPRGAVHTLLEELVALRDSLLEVLARRGADEGALGVRLRAVLGQVIGVPRHVPIAERDAAAQEALELEDGLVPALMDFGAALEAVFRRPVERGQRLPMTAVELERVRAGWAAGLAELERGWHAVRAIDLSGGVERELTKRARRGATNRSLPGPRALGYATFWRDTAEARVRAVVEERFAPLQPRESEHWALLAWLLARETDGKARLVLGVEAVSDARGAAGSRGPPRAADEDAREPPGARAALLMLAHELTAAPQGRAPLVGGRAEVRRWAEQADGLEGDPDWRRLRDALRAATTKTLRPALPPLYRVGQPAAKATVPERLVDFFGASSDGGP